MGYRTSLGKTVQSALKTVGDLAETLTYNQKIEGAYNATTGVMASSTTVHTFNGVISYKGGAVGANNISSGFTGDLTALFASNDLSVSPDTNDTITRGSETYAINNISSDPANASYTLTLTRLG